MDTVQVRPSIPKWKGAAAALGALVLAPAFVTGSSATALRGAVVLVALALIGVTLFAARKKFSLRSAESPVRVVTRSTLGPRTGIAVVEFDGKRLLVGFGEGFAQVLSTARTPRRRSSKEAAS